MARRILAAISILLISCTCSYASISSETVESAWKRVTEADGFPQIHITYLSDDRPNAYSLDDPLTISVTTGLMNILNNEDEIAGVLGHEIGHIRLGHLPKTRARMQNRKNTDEALARLAVENFRGWGQVAVFLGGEIALELSQQGFSRGEEVQADDYGVRLLKKAGYDPYGLYKAMKAFADNGFLLHPSGFNSHPPTARRLAHILKKAREVEAGAALASSKPVKQTASKESQAKRTTTTSKTVKAKSAPTRQSSTTKQVTEPTETNTKLATTETSKREREIQTIARSKSNALPTSTRTRATELAMSDRARPKLALMTTETPSVTLTAERSRYQPDGMTLYSPPVFRGTVMSAYQQAYAMNFEIWKPDDLPPGWYATFDGFPVAQIAENRWVYGQLGIDGAIRPTNILIGSVIPANVPGLLRIASAGGYSRFVNNEAFMKIREYRINRMGWLNDGYLNTIIAWHTSEPGVIIWLGNRWKRLTPNPGEYTWQMLKRLKPWILEELRKNNIFYPSGEPDEVADLARQWGIHWSGRVILDTMRAFKDSGGNGNTTSLRDTSGSSGGSDTPSEKKEDTGPQWDVD